MLDLIIIGAGPIGLVCGIEARKAGLNFLILEKGVLVNTIYRFPVNMTFFSTSKLLEIGDVPFISHADKPSRTEALEYYRRICAAWQLPIKLYEKVNSVKKVNKEFYIRSDRQEYQSKFVILTTGFYDKEIKLNIPGENLPKVSHYYDDAHPYYNQKIAIIGAGNSACDVALECFQKGADVSLIVRDHQLKESIKYWIKPNIENRIKENNIKAFFNSNLLEVKPHSIIVQMVQEIIEMDNDFVLAMTGYTPDYDFLNRIGIENQTDEYSTPVYDENTLESNLEGLYLAGVIIGGMKTNKWFIENTRDHGKKIIDHIVTKK